MAPDEVPFRRIAENLRSKIRSGELRPGDRLPSSRTLAAEWSVARGTADRALAELRNEGLALMSHGRAGTVVASDLPAAEFAIAVEGMSLLNVERVEVTGLDDAQSAALGLRAGSNLIKVRVRISPPE